MKSDEEKTAIIKTLREAIERRDAHFKMLNDLSRVLKRPEWVKGGMQI